MLWFIVSVGCFFCVLVVCCDWLLILALEETKELHLQYDKTENAISALQSVGQYIGEVLRQMDEEKCTLSVYSNDSYCTCI